MAAIAPLEQGFNAAFTPLNNPVVGSGSVGTTSSLLVADHTGILPHNVRRVRIYNTHATQILGVYLADRGAVATGGIFSDSVQIPPGQVWSAAIVAARRLLVIGSGAGTTFNFLVDDV